MPLRKKFKPKNPDGVQKNSIKHRWRHIILNRKTIKIN